MFRFLSIFSISIILYGCSSNHHPKNNGFQVTIRIKSFPDSYCPLYVSKFENKSILGKIYEQLEELDNVTNNVLSRVAFLQNIEREDRLFSFVFEIRKEAVWNNGLPITAKDIATSLKNLQSAGIEKRPLEA